MALSPILGTILEKVGPGLSARARWEARPVMEGRSARVNTSTPMPPIQCVKQRQSIRQWLMLSTSDRMLAPVVVKPDTVSNSASINRGISFVK